MLFSVRNVIFCANSYNLRSKEPHFMYSQLVEYNICMFNALELICVKYLYIISILVALCVTNLFGWKNNICTICDHFGNTIVRPL